MKRGRLGLPRPLGLGPITPGGIIFGQPENEDDMEEVLFEVLDDPDIAANDLDVENEEKIQEVRKALIQRTFPDSELKRGRLDECIDDWGSNWAEQLMDDTGGSNSTPLEELVKAMNGCRGMVESNTLERSDPDEDEDDPDEDEDE